MKLFKENGHLIPVQSHYNFVQSSSRMVIERAFSLLKGRFRRLKYVDMTDTVFITNVILVCCAFHNICLLAEDDFEDMMDDDDDWV